MGDGPLEDAQRDDDRLEGKAATQERILRAATSLFLSRGYEETTMVDVALEAGVSRATVFWHFGDKAGLFREAFIRLLAPFRAALERNLEEVPAEKRLREQIALYSDFVVHHRKAIEGFLRWAISTPDFRAAFVASLMDLHQRYTGVLTQTLSELVPADHDPRELATVLLSLLDGNLLLSFFDSSAGANESRRASVDAFASLIPRRSTR